MGHAAVFAAHGPGSLARNVHVPLPEQVHAALRGEAARSGKPATSLAREAIEAFLKRRWKLVLHEAIAVYASLRAVTKDDLELDLERAAVEQLLDAEAATTRPCSWYVVGSSGEESPCKPLPI